MEENTNFLHVGLNPIFYIGLVIFGVVIPPRVELGSSAPETDVLSITPWDRFKNFVFEGMSEKEKV